LNIRCFFNLIAKYIVNKFRVFNLNHRPQSPRFSFYLYPTSCSDFCILRTYIMFRAHHSFALRKFLSLHCWIEYSILLFLLWSLLFFSVCRYITLHASFIAFSILRNRHLSYSLFLFLLFSFRSSSFAGSIASQCARKYTNDNPVPITKSNDKVLVKRVA